MSRLRLPYFELSPEALEGFRQVKRAMENSPLGRPLIELVYLRVSQINGCAFCLNMHSKALRQLDETETRLTELAGWRASGQFTPREQAALEWAEALTHITATHAKDELYLPLKEHFSDREISDLTFAISLMNGLNRLAVGMRH